MLVIVAMATPTTHERRSVAQFRAPLETWSGCTSASACIWR